MGSPSNQKTGSPGDRAARAAACEAAATLERKALDCLRNSGLFSADWFLLRHPDLVPDPAASLVFYYRTGWREGRWPNPYFDPAWYLSENPDVAASGMEPLLHYALHGHRESRRPVPYFDAEWYRLAYAVPAGTPCLLHFLTHRHEGWVSPIPEFDPVHYLRLAPDVKAAGMDPFEHYLVQGAAEDRSPSAVFDPVWYRVRYMAHLPAGNPLLHYRANRHAPGILPSRPADDTDIAREVRRFTAPGPLFEEVTPLPPGSHVRARLLAFYLPQFHAVPENDRWWGRGFTEWTNVARALPRFAGHYQPRIPRDLGHYSLEGTETLRRQVALARGAGLQGFVFYFYWFNGRRLLDGPLEALLADPTVDFPFCLMWANENWSRRWDGSDQDVLISQDYRPEDSPALVREFVRHFRDPRYIRLQGRPVLMVYRAGIIPDVAAAVAQWRALFEPEGEDPFFVMAQSFGEQDPRPSGMDAAVEFPPHKLTDQAPRMNATLRRLDPDATAPVYAYDDVAAASDLAPQPYPLIRTAVPGWDNDARRQGAGMVLHGSTPAAYEAWLDRLIRAAVAQPVGGEALVCVNAWNEWAEGAYLEPDVYFGGAYLNATARAVMARSSRPRLLLVGHDAFPAGAQLLLLHIGRQMRARGLAIEFLLLGGGALEPAYREVAPLTVMPGPSLLPAAARALAGQGLTAALVNTTAAAQACVALASAGIASVLLVHELPRLLRERNLAAAAQAGAAAARHVVFAAPYVRDRFHELAALPAGKTVVLPQGLYNPAPGARADGAALRAGLRVPADAILAIGLGHADLRKGFDLFLQVWRMAQMEPGPPIHLLWIGDIHPEIHAYLGAEMAAASTTGTFHHLPRQDGAAAWFRAADVHLLTSREDPFPSVVLEAMSAGVPTIAFEEGGGAPDLLRAYAAGVSVPLGDAAAMARAVRRLAEPGPDAALEDVTRRDFAWDRYVDRLIDLVQPEPRRVSAVIPTYNYAHYLEGRLASVFRQTHPLLEILVLDDASTDGSEGVVRRAAEIAGRAVRWERNATNSGSVFRQWRRAAERAAGEWLWIAEADDETEPEWLETVCQALDRAPDALLAFTDSAAIDAQGRVLWPDHQAYYAQAGLSLLAQDGVFPAALFLRHCLGAQNAMLNASAVLWRRTALLAALDRCAAALDTFAMAGDWRVYAEVLGAAMGGTGSAVYVARPLNRHRRHATSVTHRLDPGRHLDEIAAMHRHMLALLEGDPALRVSQAAAMEAARQRLTGSGAHTSGRPRSTAGSAPVAARSARNGGHRSRRNSLPP